MAPQRLIRHEMTVAPPLGNLRSCGIGVLRRAFGP